MHKVERVRKDEITKMPLLINRSFSNITGFITIITLLPVVPLPKQLVEVKSDGGVFVNSIYTQLPISAGIFSLPFTSDVVGNVIK